MLTGNISRKSALVPSKEWSENFDSIVFKTHRISGRVTFSFVNILSIAPWVLLVTSDELVMTCSVVGSSFLLVGWFTHIQYVHILATPAAARNCINVARENPCWIKRIFEPIIQKHWFYMHYSIFINWSKKEKIKSEYHCIKGPVVCLSLC